MDNFEVLFYETENGRIPVEEFLNSLPKKSRAKIVGIISLLQDYGNELRSPYSEHIDDGIFELRGKVGSDITRVLYFFYYDKKIILTNGFVKKTQKNPEKSNRKSKRV